MQTAEQAAFVVSSGRTADRVKDLERIISLKQDWLFRFAYLRVGKREEQFINDSKPFKQLSTEETQKPLRIIGRRVFHIW